MHTSHVLQCCKWKESLIAFGKCEDVTLFYFLNGFAKASHVKQQPEFH